MFAVFGAVTLSFSGSAAFAVSAQLSSSSDKRPSRLASHFIFHLGRHVQLILRVVRQLVDQLVPRVQGCVCCPCPRRSVHCTRPDRDPARSPLTSTRLLPGNEYFCEVDEEYIVDRFNLTGLNAEVAGYSRALELITDTAADDDLNDEQRDQLETSARHLYGLIHARFIITSRGLSKMVRHSVPSIARHSVARASRLAVAQSLIIRLSLPPARRLTSTRRATLADAHASSATGKRCSPWV